MLFLDKFLQGLKPQFDDDVVDRLNYYYTPMLLVIFALTLSAKQYVGQPIQCWIPAQFTGAWEQYSENYCFVQNTYFLPLTHYIPSDVQEREDREIGYYQWNFYGAVLGLQGILFYLPSLIWRLLSWNSGVAVKGIVQMTQDVGNMQIDKRKTSVEVVAAHIHDALKTQQQLLKRSIFATLLRRGSYLNLLYILVKFVYLVQVLTQFVILNRFLGTAYTFWGFDILRDLAYGREWQESGHFPRVTMCDFEVRALGNKHRHAHTCLMQQKVRLLALKMNQIQLLMDQRNEVDRLVFYYLSEQIIEEFHRFLKQLNIAQGVGLFLRSNTCDTVQCVLMINMFNEKVYLFIWWWLLIVATATFASLIYWIIMSFSTAQHESFIAQYLRVSNLLDNDHYGRGALSQFTDQFLRMDGVFLLRLISSNAGDLITTDLVCQLWKMFVQEESDKARTLPLPNAPNNQLEDVDGLNNDKQHLT